MLKVDIINTKGVNMRKEKIVRIELSKEDIQLLKELIDNEVVNYSAFYKQKRANKDIKQVFEKLKIINNQLEEKLSYAGSV